MSQTVQKQPQRKRVRKRKRRNVSTSSSSSSDSDSGSGQSSSSSRPASVSKKKAGKAPAKLTPVVEPSDSSSDAEYSDSSDSEGRAIPAPKLSKSGAGQQSEQQNASSSSPNEPRERSPGLIHPASPIPELFPLPDTEEGRLEEERLRERFRKLWMSSMADSFADDLNEIRQEPNMTPDKLSFIVDLLASGADSFTQAPPGFDGLDEMKIALREDED